MSREKRIARLDGQNKTKVGLKEHGKNPNLGRDNESE